MMITRLDEETEGGSLEAYQVASCEEQLANWLDSEIGGDEGRAVTAAVRELCPEVAICKSVHVEEESRGQGIGNGLVDTLVNSSSAEVTLLIADAHEGQAEGFDLKKWYEGWGFAEIMPTAAGPLMAYPSETAELLIPLISAKLEAAASARPGP